MDIIQKETNGFIDTDVSTYIDVIFLANICNSSLKNSGSTAPLLQFFSSNKLLRMCTVYSNTTYAWHYKIKHNSNFSE